MIDKPRKIGKYDVVDVLGRGAMGVVYRGHDPYVDRPVAIKIATNVGIEGAQGVARRMFVNEARSAGRLDHPNILKVYEAGEENDLPYMVMEYIAGGDTLRNYCKEGSLLPVPVVMRIVRQAADALDYAHEQGVLHRDIKPANLMLTREGQAKIGDFGIARRIGVDQTQITGWFGSPLYMSPEQAQDLEMTPQSDLFSLGSVFYELLTGKAAFAAKGLTGLMQKILHEDPPPVHEIRTDVPEEVWAILKKMLEKDVTKRYKRGAEIVRDIDILLNDVRNVPLIFSDDQKIQRMSTLAFFEGFGKAELKEVNKTAVWQRFAPGAQIFAEGSRENTAFFVIVDGAVMVDISGVQVKELESGECFGEMEYLAGGTRSASITTSRETTVLKVERDFKEWASLPCQLRMGKAFQAMLIKRLRETSRELARALR